MERNSLEQDLIQVFNNVILNGIQDNNSGEIERVLTALIDHECTYIFRKNIICNFLYFLRQQSQTSFLIEHLINEVEQKSLRLYYTDTLKSGVNSCDCNQPRNTSGRQLQKKESTMLDKFNDSPLSQVIEHN